MDIFFEWRKVMGANTGEIMAFTVSFVRAYWRLTEQPRDEPLLDKYMQDAMSGNYEWLISTSAEFILEQTGLQMPMEYLLSDD